jgi:endonuclease III-like uncharacterized protein
MQKDRDKQKKNEKSDSKAFREKDPLVENKNGLDIKITETLIWLLEAFAQTKNEYERIRDKPQEDVEVVDTIYYMVLRLTAEEIRIDELCSYYDQVDDDGKQDIEGAVKIFFRLESFISQIIKRNLTEIVGNIKDKELEERRNLLEKGKITEENMAKIEDVCKHYYNIKVDGKQVEIKRPYKTQFKDILNLQKKYLKKNLQPEQRDKYGYVGLENSDEILQAVCDKKIMVAATYDNRVIAYQMSADSQIMDMHPLTKEVKEFMHENLLYKGKRFTECKYAFFMQLVIDKEWMSKGIAENLFVNQINNLINLDYDIVLTAVDRENKRSMRFHTKKLGMVEIADCVSDEGENWVILSKYLKFGRGIGWMEGIYRHDVENDCFTNDPSMNDPYLWMFLERLATKLMKNNT